MPKPTQQAYTELQTAYDHFNAVLFNGTLPSCLITMQRKHGAYGYFSGKRWVNRAGTLTNEIALNPAHFVERSVEDVLSTLVHEMVHLWQDHFGHPGRGRYHNREWAVQMDTVGLCPSSTGQPDGDRTGQRMSHYVSEGGPFHRGCKKLLSKGSFISWMDRATASTRKGGQTKDTSKTKYSCPTCGINAWAKAGIVLICGTCHVQLRMKI